MPDYAGAVAAIRDRLVANWSDTQIAFQNEGEPTVGPEEAWVFLEVIGNGSAIAATGKANDRPWTYDGLIHVHVFVPVGWGLAEAVQRATTIGEIFRAAKFYDDTAGYCVRTLAPSVDGGGPGDDDGRWFRVTMTVEFTYWHRG